MSSYTRILIAFFVLLAASLVAWFAVGAKDVSKNAALGTPASPIVAGGVLGSDQIDEVPAAVIPSVEEVAAPQGVKRTPAEAEGARSFRISDAVGRPVVGARATVSPLTNDVMGRFWTPSDSEMLFQIEERTRGIVGDWVAGESGSDGVVSMDVDGVLDTPEGWVLWVTHPEHAPRAIIGGEGEAEWPERIELGNARGGMASVLDADGAPVADAEVWIQGLLPEEVGAPGDPERLVRRALVRDGRTDAEGRRQLPAAGGPSLVWAVHGGRRSAPVRRSGDDPVELRLEEAFEVAGAVRSVDGTPLGQWAVVVVSALEDSGEEHRLGAVACPPEGFSGLVVPRVAGCEEYLARLMFGEVEACARRFAAPAAGGRVDLEFELRQGINYWFQVVEWANHDVQLVGFDVELTWERDGEQAGSLRAVTADGGHVHFRGVPIGVTCALTVRGEGYATFENPPRVFRAEEHDQATLIELDRAGSIRVRVTRGGEPVDGCSFGIWDDYRASAPLYVEDVLGTDGWHLLERIPAYVGSIAVVDRERPLSEPVPLEFSNVDELIEVEIELADQVPLRGRAVDAATGEPIGGAQYWLQSFSSFGSPVTVSAEPLIAGEDGRFETTFPKGPFASVFVYSAEALDASKRVRVPLGADGSFNCGDVPLVRGIELPIQLTWGGEPLNGTGYRAVLGVHQRSSARGEFDANGRCALMGPYGPRGVTIYTPRGSALGFELPPGYVSGTPVEIELNTTDKLWVEVLDERGEPVEVSGPLELRCWVSGMAASWIVQVLEPGLRVEIPRPATERALIRWGDVEDSTRRAHLAFSLSEPGDLELQLQIESTKGEVMVLDGAGEPLPGILITTAGAGWRDGSRLSAQTGADGVATLMHLPQDPEISMLGPGRSVVPMPSGTALPEPGSRVTWAFDPDQQVEVRCVEGGEPVAYAELNLSAGESPIVFVGVSADAAGHASHGPVGPGTYRVHAELPGHFPGRATVRVPGPTAELELRRIGALEIWVEDAKGDPAADLQVKVRCEDLGESVDQWQADGRLAGEGELRTDAAGRCALDGLPWGRYRVEVAGVSGTAVVEPGSIGRLELQAP